MAITKRHSLGIAAVGVVSAASIVLAGTVASATTSGAAGASVAQTATAKARVITTHSSVTSVKAWHLFRVTGTATGVKPGSKMVLQQKQGKRWVTLPAMTPLKSKGTYSLGVMLGLKGKNDLRIVNGSTASPVFSVGVR